MHKEKLCRIAVFILSLIVVIQALFIAALWMRLPKKIPRVAPPVPVVKAKIAIVFDDWGYNLNNLNIASQIKYPLTMSVLPNLTYSKTAAEELHAMGFEIILHLPMEPREKFRLEKNTIMTTMNEAAIKKIIAKDLESVPYAKGVSNHMGSMATGNARTMEAVFKELGKRHLYFLDSFVFPQSVCSDLSAKMGLGFAKRDVFLDNKEDYAYITGQVRKLKLRAKVKGSAIGIGHDRNMTLTILKELMPQLEKEGFEFVFLSELVK